MRYGVEENRGGEPSTSDSYSKPSKFTCRCRTVCFDWRLLHGVDLLKQVRRADSSAVRRAETVEMLLNGNIELEDVTNLSARNVLQLLWFLQVATQFACFRQERLAKLNESTEACILAIQAVNRCLQTRKNQQQSSFDEVSVEEGPQDCSSAMLAYDVALQHLAESERELLDIRYRTPSARINWQMVHSFDAGQLGADADTARLQSLVDMVTSIDLQQENWDDVSVPNYVQLVQLSQIALEYAAYLAHAASALQNELFCCHQHERDMKERLTGYVRSANDGVQYSELSEMDLTPTISSQPSMEATASPQPQSPRALPVPLSQSAAPAVQVQHVYIPVPTPCYMPQPQLPVSVLQPAQPASPTWSRESSLADDVEEAVRSEWRHTSELRSEISSLWERVARMKAFGAPLPSYRSDSETVPAVPAPPPIPCTTGISLDVEGLRAEVRQQAEARLRFQVEAIKRRAFQDVQHRVTADLMRASSRLTQELGEQTLRRISSADSPRTRVFADGAPLAADYAAPMSRLSTLNRGASLAASGARRRFTAQEATELMREQDLRYGKTDGVPGRYLESLVGGDRSPLARVGSAAVTRGGTVRLTAM